MNQDAPPFVLHAPGDRQEMVWTSERCYITELLNDEREPDVSLALARVEEGVTTQLHALRDVEEVYIVRSGSGVIEVDGQSAPVKVGDSVVIPPSVSQRIESTGPGDLEFYCLCRPRFRESCYVNLEERPTTE